MKLREEIGRLGLKLTFYPRFNFKFSYENFDRKRKEPYVLIANHASLNDPLYIGMKLKYYPYPVASNTLYTHKVLNFLLTKVITSIPKRKGQSDIQTIRSMLKAFKEDKRGIMLFPEGNSSYFGEETKTDYESTAKLIKKIGHEVVYAKIDGGFLAAPRWGKFRKKGDYHVHFAPIISKEEVKTLDIPKITEILTQTIKFNDYDWNREKRIKYRSNQKAEGLEHYIYYCPICGNKQTITTKGNDIYCTSCGKISEFDDYGFLKDLPFDNLVEWGKLQRSMISEFRKTKISSSGDLLLLDFENNKRIPIDTYLIELEHDVLTLKNESDLKQFKLDRISGLVLTQKQYLSFDYDEKTYMIKAQDPMIILDAINDYKGDK